MRTPYQTLKIERHCFHDIFQQERGQSLRFTAPYLVVESDTLVIIVQSHNFMYKALNC